jgi:hypothetical protein
VQYTSPGEVAVCNLASVVLPKFVTYGADGRPTGFNHTRLAEVTAVVTRNLNRIIDRNLYPGAWVDAWEGEGEGGWMHAQAAGCVQTKAHIGGSSSSPPRPRRSRSS